MRRFVPTILALLLTGVSGLALAQAAIPELRTRITDPTGTLDAADVARIEAPLVALESEKGAQVAVLMVSSTQPDSIEAYAVRAFEQWKLGRAGVDDGVLLVVARDDRTVRIEVGYGLEGAIPDVAAHRVIQDYLLPRFREGDFAGGIADATAALAKLINGEALPDVQASQWSNAGDGFYTGIDGKMLLGVFLAFMLSMMMRGMTEAIFSSLPQWARAQWQRARWLRGVIVGSAMGGFFHAISTGFDWPVWLVAFAATVGFVVGIWKIKTSSSGYSGGDSGGSDGSYGGSSDSSSSSDYSGGGGSSGGGGASGSW